jgi:HAD superfamily hydrolase (TIGR01484 family)
MSRPLRELTGSVRALFSDVDGTLTTRGRVEASTYLALEQLGDAGIDIILVTGRPAGWGQALMSLVPVVAVVSENGGVSFIRREGKLEKLYGVAPASLPDWRRRMHAAAVDVMSEIPGARLSSDSRYREADLAIDWNEEASLSKEEADRAVEMLERRGFKAARSSVHVNFGPPEFNKLSACKKVIKHALGADPELLEPYVYVGDALNDAPMFGGFPRSVGVANIKAWWDELEHTPSFLTDEAEGAGLRALCARVLALGRG